MRKREKDQRILVSFKMEVYDADRGCYFSVTFKKAEHFVGT